MTTMLEVPADWFMARVEVRGDGECWPWTGPTQKYEGRERYGWAFFRQGKFMAHRLSWTLHNGREPEPGMFVMHSCDTPACVNPAHLRLGTHADNMRDAKAKGRLNWQVDPSIAHRGEKCPTSRLTTAEVYEIRRLYDVRVPTRQIATQFSITLRHARELGRRRAWAHLPEANGGTNGSR